MAQDAPFDETEGGQVLHPGSRQLFRHWEKLRAERPCPTREAFDLVPLSALLADLIVIDRDYLRNGFKFRLAGTRACRLFGFNLTGLSVTAGWDTFEADVISRHLLTAINQVQPAVLRMRLSTDNGQAVAAELLALPVHMRASHRIQLIGGLFPFRVAQAIGHTSISARELVSARMIWTEHSLPGSAVSVPLHPPFDRSQQRRFSVIEGGKV